MVLVLKHLFCLAANMASGASVVVVVVVEYPPCQGSQKVSEQSSPSANVSPMSLTADCSGHLKSIVVGPVLNAGASLVTVLVRVVYIVVRWIAVAVQTSLAHRTSEAHTAPAMQHPVVQHVCPVSQVLPTEAQQISVLGS